MNLTQAITIGFDELAVAGFGRPADPKATIALFVREFEDRTPASVLIAFRAHIGSGQWLPKPSDIWEHLSVRASDTWENREIVDDGVVCPENVQSRFEKLFRE